MSKAAARAAASSPSLPPAAVATEPPPIEAGAEEGPVALASSTQCDLSNGAFVRLLIAEFRAGRDGTVRDGIAKALALSGEVNGTETTVADSYDLGAEALVDAYMAALEFAASLSFSAIQTQQLLLLLVDVLDLLPSYAPRLSTSSSCASAAAATGGGAADETPSASSAAASPPLGAMTISTIGGPHPLNMVLYHFSRKLARLCAATPMLVDERSVVVEERIEEHVDPAAQAAYDAKLAKAKKGQVVEPPPRVAVTVRDEKEVFERKTILVGPYFDQADVARIVDFFNASVFQHWALFQTVLTCPRGVDREAAAVLIDNVPTFLAPLSAAVPLDDYVAAQERLAVETEAEDAIAALDAALCAEWADLTRDAAAGAAAVKARDDADRESDAAAAMSAAEFEHAKRVLEGAVKAATQKKTTSSGLLARIERVEAAAATGGILQATRADASPVTAGSPVTASPKGAAATRK